MTFASEQYASIINQFFNLLTGQGAFRLSFRARIIAFLVAVIVPIATILFVLTQDFIYSTWLLVDMRTAAEMSGDACCSPAYGAVSTVGIMIWSGTAAGCLMAAMVFGSQKADLRDFTALAGILTLCLVIDDAFLFHEVWFPMIGISETVVYMAYVAIAVAYVLRSWRVLLAADYWLLVVAAISLAGSMGLDLFVDRTGPRAFAAEDGAKFVGICAWATFHLSTVAVALRSPSPHLETNLR